jgi:prepilin-type N-terminal cleavage/methylation domain-containing protein
MQRAMSRGYTLVELLVVMVVLTIMVSLVSFNVSAFSGHALDGAAAQWAASLEAARWQAVSTRRRIAWQPPSPQAQSSLWLVQDADHQWRPYSQFQVTAAYAAPEVTVSLVTPTPASTDTPRLVLGPEAVGAASCVTLTQGTRTLAISSDGVSPYTVRHDGRCH